jgi:hypothetical protein
MNAAPSDPAAKGATGSKNAGSEGTDSKGAASGRTASGGAGSGRTGSGGAASGGAGLWIDEDDTAELPVQDSRRRPGRRAGEDETR